MMYLRYKIVYEVPTATAARRNPMTTLRTLEAPQVDVPGALSGTVPAREPASVHSARYRLEVMTRCAADAVRCVGGWIFDRAMQGFDVDVLLPHRADARPLEILGANIRELSPAASNGRQAPGPLTIVISTDLWSQDMHPCMHAGLHTRTPQIFFWGDTGPAELPGDPVQHHLSAAARAFKAQALIAADLAPTVDPDETFWAPVRSARLDGTAADHIGSALAESFGAQAVTGHRFT
jgi:hypothetical protein